MTQTPLPELDRFRVLFDRLVTVTNDWISQTPPDRLEWVPVDNQNVRFGDRVSLVTIKSLYVHVAVGEHHWMRNLKQCREGATIPLPKNPELTAQLMRGDFVGEAMKLHQGNMRILDTFTEDDLRKSIHFSDCTWSTMGFLWAIYAHRAYHLGNIDIYLRQSDTKAPDFFHFHPTMMA